MKEFITHINTINALSEQIKALLDLMQMSEDSVDHQSIKTASEMCITMHMELMKEVEDIEKEWKEAEEEKLPGDYIEEMIQRQQAGKDDDKN